MTRCLNEMDLHSTNTVGVGSKNATEWPKPASFVTWLVE